MILTKVSVLYFLRWVTVNSPLRYQIHRWAPNIRVIGRFGPPPTELWVTDTVRGVPSFQVWWAVAWSGRLVVGEWEFPELILQVITSWIVESWLSSFPMVFVYMFPKVLLRSEVSHSVKMLLTLLCIEMHTDVNKKGEKPNKTETFTQMADLLMWKVFLFYYFQAKIRKTFARVGKTPEWFFRLAFDATE